MTQLKPIEPDSADEWDLEQAAFASANDPTLPQHVRDLIGKLWAECVAREQWRIKVTTRKPPPFNFDDI